MTTLHASIYEPGDNAFSLFPLLFEPSGLENRRHQVCCQSPFGVHNAGNRVKKVTVMKLQYQQTSQRGF